MQKLWQFQFLKYFFEREKEIVFLFSKIIFLSFGVKSPSGPISIVFKLSPFMSSFFNFSLELISAKKAYWFRLDY